MRFPECFLMLNYTISQIDLKVNISLRKTLNILLFSKIKEHLFRC